MNRQIGTHAIGLRVVGCALANWAKHKLVARLSQRRSSEGVYVRENILVEATRAGPRGGSPSLLNTLWDLTESG